MDAAEREAVKALVGGGAFVRFAAEDDALLVSDAPRRMVAEALADAVARLTAAGYLCRVTERGLLAIDWNETRWAAFAARHSAGGWPPWPHDEALHACYALVRLLLLHPAPWAAQPRPLLRALVKALARRGGLCKAAPALLAACARRLRRHEALPSAGAGLILAALPLTHNHGEGMP
jgi:hypothetical protein